jgi:hypothetical protein
VYKAHIHVQDYINKNKFLSKNKSTLIPIMQFRELQGNIVVEVAKLI